VERRVGDYSDGGRRLHQASITETNEAGSGTRAPFFRSEEANSRIGGKSWSEISPKKSGRLHGRKRRGRRGGESRVTVNGRQKKLFQEGSKHQNGRERGGEGDMTTDEEFMTEHARSRRKQEILPREKGEN